MRIWFWSKERGGILIMTLGILAIVNILLWVVMQTVVTERKITYNVIQNEQAILASDAALALAEQAVLQAGMLLEGPLDLSGLQGEFILPGSLDAYFTFSNGQILEETSEFFSYQVECIGVAGKARHQVRVVLFYDALEQTVTCLSYEEV